MSDAAKRQMPTGEGLTFEKVWAMFQESKLESERERKESKLESEREWKKSREEFKESKRKSELEWKEIRKEFQESKRKSELEWKEIREQMKETDRQMKETDKKFGELGIRFGEVVEHLVAPGIIEKFNEMGYHFGEVYEGGAKIFDKNGQKKAEIDILMENGETVLAVEVKSKPNNMDIREHIKRLKILRESRREKKDVRKIIGAIAGAVFKDNVKEAAQKAGFYVIVQSGDTMKIDIPDGWAPAEF
jgi:hypothetical protein